MKVEREESSSESEGSDEVEGSEDDESTVQPGARGAVTRRVYQDDSDGEVEFG